jgi:hypothetical protein
MPSNSCTGEWVMSGGGAHHWELVGRIKTASIILINTELQRIIKNVKI